MPATYDRFGIRFLFPEDWGVTDEEGTGGLKTVSVQSASGAFWSVSMDYSARSSVELLRETLHTMREVYKEVEVTGFETVVAGQAASGYEMEFFCLDLMITAKAIAWRNGSRSVLVLYQAENREFDQKEGIFEAISTSLIQEFDRVRPSVD
jgi:hypothetical protein